MKNRGDTLLDLNRPADALASYDAALALAPDDAGMGNDRGIALGELGRHGEAVAAFDGVLARNPDYAEARANRGQRAARPQALRGRRRVLRRRWSSARRTIPSRSGQLLHARMLCCDWTGLDQLATPGPRRRPGRQEVGRALRLAGRLGLARRPAGAAPRYSPRPTSRPRRRRCGAASATRTTGSAWVTCPASSGSRRRRS